MGFIDRISKIVSQTDSDYYDENNGGEYSNEYFQDDPEPIEEPIDEPVPPKKTGFGVFRSSSSRADRGGDDSNVYDINRAPARKNKVVLVQPAVFSDAKRIADQVNQKYLVVLNLKEAGSDTTRRFVDFLSGVTYANGGKITRIDTAVFIITPSGYDLTGDMVESIQNGEIYFG